MPNAAASLDADFGQRAPARRKPPRAAARKKGRKPSLAQRAAMFDRVPRYGAIAISALIGVGIVVNALMMQHGNHPAPLFGAAPVHAAAAKPAAPKPAASPEAARPEPIVAQAEPPAGAPAAPADPIGRPASHMSRASHGDDPIARLLSAGPTGATGHKVKVAADRPAVKPPKVAPEKRRRGED